MSPSIRTTAAYVVRGHGIRWIVKTGNCGLNGAPIFDEGGSYSPGVVVDPKSSDTVWLGTGENQGSAP